MSSSLGRLELLLGADISRLRKDLKDAEALSRASGGKFAKAFSGGIDDISTEVEQLKGQLRTLGVDVRDSEGLDRLTRRLKEADSAAGSARPSITNLQAAITGLAAGAAFAALDLLVNAVQSLTQAAVGFIRESLDLNTQLRAVDNALTQILGSSEAAGTALGFLRQVSDNTGQSLSVLQQSYLGVSAAAKEVSVSQQSINELFAETARVGAILGLDNEGLGQTFTALQQITSKGVVSMEELRQQLGEQLPVAFGATARGLGITVDELNELVSSGGLASSEFIPAFIAGLRDIEGEVDPVIAALGRFENRIQDIQRDVGAAIQPVRGAFIELADGILESASATVELDRLTDAGERLQASLRENPEVAQRLGEALGELANLSIDAIIDGIERFNNLLSENPEAITERVDDFLELANAISSATGVLVDVVVFFSDVIQAADETIDKYQEITERIPVIGALLRLPADIAELAINPLGAMADRIRDVQERLQQLAEFARDPFGSVADSAASALERVQNLGGSATSPIESAAISVDTQPVESLTDAISTLAGAEQKLAGSAALAGSAVEKSTESIEKAQRERLDAVRAANAAIVAEINQERDAEVIEVRQAQLSGDLDSDAAAGRIVDAQLQASQRLIGAKEAELATIAQLEQEGVLTAEQAAEERQKLTADISRASISLLEAELDEKERLRERELAQIEQANQRAEAELQRSQTERIAAVRQAQLSGGLSEAEASQQVQAIEQNATAQRIELRRQELAQLSDLRARGLIDAEEAAGREIELQQEIADVNLQRLEQEIQARREARLREIDDTLGIQSQQADIGIQGQRGDEALLNAQAELAQATANLAVTQLETQVAQAEAAGDSALAEQLRGRILDEQRGQMEAQFKIQQSQLKLSQEIQRAELERERINAQIALAQAEAEGASEAVLDLQRQRLALVDESISRQTQIESLQDATLAAQQQITAEQQKQKEISDEQAQQERERARLLGIISGQLNETDEERATEVLDGSRERLGLAASAGLVDRDERREGEQTIRQVERLVGASDERLLRAAIQERDNELFGQLLQDIGRGDIVDLAAQAEPRGPERLQVARPEIPRVEAPSIETPQVSAQREIEQSGPGGLGDVRTLLQELQQITQFLASRPYNLNITTEQDPGTVAGQVYAEQQAAAIQAMGA